MTINPIFIIIVTM